MELHDELQVKAFEDYLKENRFCERCKEPLSNHMPAEEGYVRPSLTGNCLDFTDAISREAAEKLTAGRFQRGPAGYCH